MPVPRQHSQSATRAQGTSSPWHTGHFATAVCRGTLTAIVTMLDALFHAPSLSASSINARPSWISFAQSDSAARSTRTPW